MTPRSGPANYGPTWSARAQRGRTTLSWQRAASDGNLGQLVTATLAEADHGPAQCSVLVTPNLSRHTGSALLAPAASTVGSGCAVPMNKARRGQRCLHRHGLAAAGPGRRAGGAPARAEPPPAAAAAAPPPPRKPPPAPPGRPA